MTNDELYEQLEEQERKETLAILTLMFLLVNETKKAIQNEIMLFYQKYGTDGVVTYDEARKYVSSTERKRRINVLIAFILSQFKLLKSQLTIKFEDLEETILNKELDFFDVEIDKPPTKWGEDDLSWKERLDKNIELWIVRIVLETKQAMVHQDDVTKVIELFDKRFVSIEKALKKLGLSESSAMTSNARKEIFKLLGIKQFKFYARLDERMCEHCGGMHGKIFPITAYEVGVTAPPIHSNCRCWTMPH